MRVLHLTTYPVELPRHGGQARVSNICATYAAAGITSRVIAVYEPENYGPEALGAHDLAFPLDSPHRRRDLPFCTDLASGEFAARDTGAWAHIHKQLLAFRPDVLQLEQPWLWPVVDRARRDAAVPSFRVVYSSQNVEAPLKRRVLQGCAAEQVETVVAEIEALEQAVTRAADLVVAVTASDARTYEVLGARRVILARNGIVERAVDPELLAYWKKVLRGIDFALFVGSAYPPNVAGFWEMFAPSLAFLAPHQRILVVGGISHVLPTHPGFSRWREVNASRLLFLGPREEAVLAVLLELAACIVLPITTGGGSNIKTAEAIYSRKPIVGTTTSFRGYEDVVAELSGIHRTDDPGEFRRQVKRAIDGLVPRPVDDRLELRRRVLWKEALAALPRELRSLARDVPVAPGVEVSA